MLAVGLFLLVVSLPAGSSAGAVTLRACAPSGGKREPQPYTLPPLKVQWDGWQVGALACFLACPQTALPIAMLPDVAF